MAPRRYNTYNGPRFQSAGLDLWVMSVGLMPLLSSQPTVRVVQALETSAATQRTDRDRGGRKRFSASTLAPIATPLCTASTGAELAE